LFDFVVIGILMFDGSDLVILYGLVGGIFWVFG